MTEEEEEDLEEGTEEEVEGLGEGEEEVINNNKVEG
jgi:hypothetical protein